MYPRDPSPTSPAGLESRAGAAPDGAHLPRPEHPRPQFVREPWLSLNGPWAFAAADAPEPPTDAAASIRVPFCPESSLSGLGRRAFQTALRYRRTAAVPSGWEGLRPVLHFGAVDFACEVRVDGEAVGRHVGGSSPFAFDLSGRVRPGVPFELELLVHDDPRTRLQPSGKQSQRPESHSVFYTRVSGVWQSVWLEGVPERSLARVRQLPDLAGGRLVLIPAFHSARAGDRWSARLLSGGTVAAAAEGPAAAGVPLALDIAEPIAWSPERPHLYDLELELRDEAGRTLDRVASYAGLRSLHWTGGRLLLNGEPLYPRLVLDQGYYPDGIWTAPSDAALRRDIELAQAAGFNGARLHQKAFEERYHYWADRLGFLTWAESPSWGFDEAEPEACRRFLDEWRALVERDADHPSIVAWTPFNETDPALDPEAHARLVREAVALTRALDPTRPVNDASGWVHVDTDLWTVHQYEQDPERFARLLGAPPDPLRNEPALEPAWTGQPYLVDEFGGIKWIPDPAEERPSDWGYGEPPTSEEAFLERLEGLVEVLLGLEHVAGWCYTQLTDVEQERNGVYTYDRRAKFPLERLRAILGRTPAGRGGGGSG